MRFLITSAAALLLCVSCASSCSQRSDKHDRGLLASKMINLSAAVDFHFSELPAAPFALDDAELLVAATTHDKLLLAEEFDHYQLKVEYQNAHAVLLLCTKEGQALMEDGGLFRPPGPAGVVGEERPLHIHA